MANEINPPITSSSLPVFLYPLYNLGFFNLRSTFRMSLISSRLFLLKLCGTMFKIVGIEGDHISTGDKPGSVGEEVVHFFERTLLSLWQECPEEECVGEIADLSITLARFVLMGKSGERRTMKR
jgi:hypothetical protein